MDTATLDIAHKTSYPEMISMRVRRVVRRHRSSSSCELQSAFDPDTLPRSTAPVRMIVAAPMQIMKRAAVSAVKKNKLEVCMNSPLLMMPPCVQHQSSVRFALFVSPAGQALGQTLGASMVL